MPRFNVLLRNVLVGALLLCSGCFYSMDDGEYVTPPTVVSGSAPVDRETSGKRVVVIGTFRNPAKASVRWKDIGSGMSDALARTLLNRGDFDVWVSTRLSLDVEQILSGPADQQAAGLGQLQEANQRVRFVVTGQVTDFHHTSQLPASLRRGRKGTSEALVAIQINIVDLDTRRQIVADHVFGIAPTDDSQQSINELYAGVSMSSYLFWSTPLGRASKQAIERSMRRLNQLVPTSDESLRIVRHIEARRVLVSGGAHTTLRRGSEYFVCIHDEAEGTVRPVLDEHTRLPVRVRIEQTSRLSTTAWLMGQQASDVDLRGAILTSGLPPATPVMTTAAASTEVTERP